MGVAQISNQSSWHLVDFFWITIVVNVEDMCLSKMTILRNLIGRKTAQDHPCSLLFSFYQLKIGSIVAPSESMKFPIGNYFYSKTENIRKICFHGKNLLILGKIWKICEICTFKKEEKNENLLILVKYVKYAKINWAHFTQNSLKRKTNWHQQI